VPEEVAIDRLEDTDGDGGKAGPPGCCPYECGEAGGPSDGLDAEAEVNRCRVGDDLEREVVD